MKKVRIKSVRKLLQHRKKLESKLNVELIINGNVVEIRGSPEEEYFAERVLEALDYPFLIEDALLLKNENFVFEVLKIRDFTPRKNLENVKGRLIGTKGKTLKVLQELSECEIVVKDNEVAIIGSAEFFENAKQAVISLIQGSKQGNVYGSLERKKS